MPLQLKCGQCIGCRITKQRSWAIRAMHEAQMHSKNCFLTLTYSDDSLPTDLSLDVAHWQLFAKRVRKAHGPFRFLHCGEYGAINLRPHYHALMFGHDFSADSIPVPGPNPGHSLRVSASLSKLWPHGYHTIGPVTPATARYVAQYTLKKTNGDAKESASERVDAFTGEVTTVAPQYATMSRRPGLGTSWFNKYFSDVYPDNFVVFDGKQCTPPPFYDILLERRDPELYSKVIQQRKKHIKTNAWNHTQDRLDVRETVAQAKRGLYAASTLD